MELLSKNTLSLITFPLISFKTGLFFLISSHIAGLIGLQWEATKELFTLLVPFNLIFTFFLVFARHTDWNKQFLFFVILTFIAGFMVELAGVHTGLIFGSYHYGDTLGFKLFDIPLLIGLNWLVLIYSIGVICQRFKTNDIVKSLAGACLMITLDIFIEQVAIRNDFWHWQNNIIPVHNFIGWFITAFMLFYIFNKLKFHKDNDLALPLYIIQFVFFLSHTALYLIAEN